MNMEQRFKDLLAQYCTLSGDEVLEEMRFREDLGMSSLDFATLLGEVEDEFDLDLEIDDSDEESMLMGAKTVGEALELLKRYL